MWVKLNCDLCFIQLSLYEVNDVGFVSDLKVVKENLSYV